MRRRLSLHVILVVTAAALALVLTVGKRVHEGVSGVAFSTPSAWAAPGTAAVPRHDLSELKAFHLTLIRIKEAYVDPSRIDPKKMLYQALDSVQLNIPEVLVEPDEAADRLTVVVNDKRQTFSTADVDSPWRLAKTLKQIFAFVEPNMNPGADLAAVEYAAVNGMLETLDPHSVLMDPEAARELDASTSGKFGGLGIVIRMIDRKLMVVRPMKNTPAGRAGIKAGDHIVKIDHQSTDVLTSDEAVDRMRGKPETPVTLWISRKGVADPMRFDLIRAEISSESVRAKLLDGGVGLIKISNFQGSTGAETDRALTELRAGGATGIILDLRGNPGGLLDQAVTTADLFVDRGTIVTTVKGGQRKPRRAERGDAETNFPVVVLINSGSASASEIVAGALKNLDRALIVGTRSFGKGSVQQLYRNDRDGTTLKLTVEQYLTPGDRSIQGVGIVPDVALARQFVPADNDGPEDFLRLLPPTRSWGEKDLDAHLTSSFAKDTDQPSYELPFLYEKPKDRPADAPPPTDDDDPDDDIVMDFETVLARDLLVEAGADDRPAMIKAARALITKRRVAEEAKLGAALGKLGVDWSAPPATAEPPAKLTATVALDQPGPLAPGAKVAMTATVTNSGAGPAYRVHLRTHADDGIFDDDELVIGKVAPGQTRTFTTWVEVPKDAIRRVDRLTFDLAEARGATAPVPPVSVAIEAAPRPTFAYRHQLIDEGNGDGLLQRRERHRMRVSVRNTGDGPATETTAVLRNASGDGVVLDSSRMEIGELPAGGEKTVEFAFTVQPDLVGDTADIELVIYDAQVGAQSGEKLKFPVMSSGAAVVAAGGVVEAKANNTELREGASADAAVIATAARGTRWKVLGTVGPWTKVELDDGAPGFVATRAIGRSGGKPGGSVTARYQVTPPTIRVSTPTHDTTAARLTLTGTVTDDTHVEDVYVFVANSAAKIQTRKVLYRSNRGGADPRTLALSGEIPLWPGSNVITIVARESADVKTMSTTVVYRDAPTTAAAP
ncbi:MAG: PDZ domain-containing protein [Kofleriaceae bacterium]|jgi:carboxyl-terminal processing protease|nr:PDZ domain-containing protein [Kofleriaceae bacterium]MBP9166971.1 PDZ domain-containing protein [Kofleriaceae bacterium]MBP9858282.1 PDZ domain-containing protein [Kofleriaceae bacterium]